MLNVSYKILAKAMVLRMCYLLPLTVRIEQIGFIQMLFILDNELAIWEGMEWARCLRLQALFINLDFEKAYNQAEWPFIMDMLRGLYFGQLFMQCVETLFSNT
jgi:hypothetical protein